MTDQLFLVCVCLAFEIFFRLEAAIYHVSHTCHGCAQRRELVNPIFFAGFGTSGYRRYESFIYRALNFFLLLLLLDASLNYDWTEKLIERLGLYEIGFMNSFSREISQSCVWVFFFGRSTLI